MTLQSSTRITRTAVRIIRRPLRQAFRIATGEHRVLENVLFDLRLSDGTIGQGEAGVAPHITGETVTQTRSNLHKAAHRLRGRDVGDFAGLAADVRNTLPKNPCAWAAVETALLDAMTRQAGIPLWRFFGPRCQRLRSDITIVIADLDETEAAARHFYRQGFRAFKIKVGQGFDDDVARVLAVKKATPRSQIILDANQAYTAVEALKFLRTLKRHGVRPVMFEQPVSRHDWDGLKTVSRGAGLLVCADESVSSMNDLLKLIRLKAAPAVNVKLMKSGLLGAADIARTAAAAGLQLMIGGMMETSLAMTAAAHLAAGLGCFSVVDLDTPFFLRSADRANPYLNRAGVYDLSRCRAGVGVTVKSGK